MAGSLYALNTLAVCSKNRLDQCTIKFYVSFAFYLECPCRSDATDWSVCLPGSSWFSGSTSRKRLHAEILHRGRNKGPPISRLCFCCYLTHWASRGSVWQRPRVITHSELALRIQTTASASRVVDSSSNVRQSAGWLRPELTGRTPGVRLLSCYTRYL